MHRTNLVPSPKIWCLLLGLAVAGMTTARTNAQTVNQVEMIPINGTKTISVKPAKVMKVNVVKPGVVRVDVSTDARAVLITGEAPGKTQVSIEDNRGGVLVVNVVVQTDVEYLRFLIKRTVPTANVEPIPVGNNVIILSGTVAKAEDVPIILGVAQSVAGQGVVNGMRVGGVMQVQLDVVIAQVSRNELRNMSFSFFTAGENHFFGSVLPGGAGSGSVAVGPAAAAGALTGSTNLLLGLLNDENGFFAFLQALRNEGLAKFLAEPRLVTLSGRPASFLSGGRLAIPEPSGLGTNAVRFENFGTELNFLPIVLGNGKIYLEVEPVVNNVNASLGTQIGGTTVPGFDTQRLHTSVELEAGQTLILGGLIQTQINATSSKIPVLGDLPFLNPFFSSKSYSQTETELLIVVTPHLVDPVTCDQLPKYLPGQETRIPDDFELFLEGILEAPRGQRVVFPGGHYQAAYLNGPSSGMYPCGNGGCYGNQGGCASGRCGNAGYAPCGTTTPGYRAGVGYQSNAGSVPVSPAPRTLPATLPAGYDVHMTLGQPTVGRPTAGRE